MSYLQMVPGFRVRIIPVLGSIPAIFGMVMASYVVTQLAELQVQTEPIVNMDVDHYRLLHQRLTEHEESLYGTAKEVQVWKYSFTLVLADNCSFLDYFSICCPSKMFGTFSLCLEYMLTMMIGWYRFYIYCSIACASGHLEIVFFKKKKKTSC